MGANIENDETNLGERQEIVLASSGAGHETMLQNETKTASDKRLLSRLASGRNQA